MGVGGGGIKARTQSSYSQELRKTNSLLLPAGFQELPTLRSYTNQTNGLWDGAAHSGLSQLTIKTVSHRCTHKPTWSKILVNKTLQVILGCIRLTVKTNQQTLSAKLYLLKP